ncbi:hypothetical protein [Cellulophaga fucicola]|uniref:Uncharacterized protein n=1 Tax=Cellulophaga fucicola TaxID=76595 RepID=A0A1K1QD32_9FLAO|nr:hypothetical protein [Cellulophaga fucicola]SFW57832.1 hypothetical protein SAMN05660313_02620 [Cellulophaga fucicola]
MKNRKLGLTLSIIGFLIAISGIFFDNLDEGLTVINGMKYLGVFMLISGSLITYFSSQPYTLEFKENDWQETKEGYQILIKNKKHKKNSPLCTILMRNNEGFEEIFTDIQINPDAVLFKISGSTFDGKLIIK